MISILEESKKSRRMGFLGKNKKIIIGGLILIIVGYAGYSYFRGNKTQTVQTAPKEWIVKQDDLQIAIEADGKVVAEDGVELSFSVSGDNLEVEDVFVKEGDKVKKGDKIATVKTETLEFNLRNAYSSYQSSLADYNNTMSGATEEEKQNALDKISSYEISLESILPDSDDILGIDHKSVNDNFEENLGAKDITTLSHANNSYIQAKNKKEELEPIAVSLDRYSDYKDTEAAAVIATETLNIFEDHLYDMRTMLESTITSTNLSKTSLDALKSTINPNRTTINTKISVLADDIDDIQDAKDALDDYVQDYEDALRDLENAKKNAERDIANSESSLKSKELSLEQAKRDYNDLIAPLTDAELASARSKLTSASINLEKANLELDKATIISPIDGEVAMLNYKKGDIIVDNSSSDPVAVIINNDTLFIEVNIEEADINKISVGQKAYATFDALNDLKFEGEISFISLTSETSNSGIVTYLVRIIITNTGEAKIREGMTAFVDFIIAEANNVLSIPVAAVRNIEGNPSTTLENGEIKKVTTGFTDGKNVEVINGLNAGDKIIY